MIIRDGRIYGRESERKSCGESLLATLRVSETIRSAQSEITRLEAANIAITDQLSLALSERDKAMEALEKIAVYYSPNIMGTLSQLGKIAKDAILATSPPQEGDNKKPA